MNSGAMLRITANMTHFIWCVLYKRAFIAFCSITYKIRWQLVLYH